MSRDLINRLRKNRELKIPVGNRFVFLARRPTDEEFVRLTRSADAMFEIASRHVIGWEQVTANDITGDGSTDYVSFSRELWAEWCADRPDFWEPISTAILDAYTAHANEVKEAAKNSQLGSS